MIMKSFKNGLKREITVPPLLSCLTLMSFLSLSILPLSSNASRHPASKYSRYLDACNNTYLLERRNDDEKHTPWYSWPRDENLADPDDITVPSPGCEQVPEGFKFKKLLATHTAAWKWYRFPYKYVNASTKCADAFDNLFSRPWNEMCDVPFRLWQRDKTEEPLYAWQARHPCRTECQEKLEDGLHEVVNACSSEDVNFNAAFSGELEVIELTTLARIMIEKIVFTCRTRFADFEDPWKACKENPLAGPQRYLDEFLRETYNSPPHETFSERRCTRCTELWLSRSVYNTTWISDHLQYTYPRVEIPLSRLWVAAVRCRSREFLDKIWQQMVNQYNLPLDWQDHKVEDKADLILRGPLPGDYPIKELYDGICDGDGDQIGMTAYDRLLQGAAVCNPFLSQDEVDYYVKPNIFLKIAYCEPNCHRGLLLPLEAVGSEFNHLGRGFAWYRNKRYFGPPPNHKMGPLFVEMWNRIKDYQEFCGYKMTFDTLFTDFSSHYKPEFGRRQFEPKYRGWYADGKGVPLLSQYVGDTIGTVRELLEADPDLALRVYEKEQNALTTGDAVWGTNILQKSPPYNRISAKKAYICHPLVEAAVRFAVQKDEGTTNKWWWQLYRTAYGKNRDRYLEFVKTILETAKEYFEICQLKENEELLETLGYLPTEERLFREIDDDKSMRAVRWKQDLDELSERLRASPKDMEIRLEWLRDGFPNEDVTRYLTSTKEYFS